MSRSRLSNMRSAPVRAGQVVVTENAAAAVAEAKALVQDATDAIGVVDARVAATALTKADRMAAVAKTPVLMAGVDFALPVGYGPGTAAAINAVIQGGATHGYKEITLPSEDILLDDTIDNNVPGVMVRGLNTMRQLPINATLPAYGCRLIAQPSCTGAMLKHRTPDNPTGAKFTGGGFRDIWVDGNEHAARGLDVYQVNNSWYDLSIRSCVGVADGDAAAVFRSGIPWGSPNNTLGEDAGVQYIRAHLAIDQAQYPAGRNTHCVILDGPSLSNVSINFDIQLSVTYHNGDGLKVRNADSCWIYLAGVGTGGTGKTLRMHGYQGLGVDKFSGGTCMVFPYLGAPPGGIVLEGTETPGVVLPASCRVYWLDSGNGASPPTAGNGLGTGATFIYEDSFWFRGGHAMAVQEMFSNIRDISVRAQALALLDPGASMLTYNTSGSYQQQMTDGTSVWGPVINAQGNLELHHGVGPGDRVVMPAVDAANGYHLGGQPFIFMQDGNLIMQAAGRYFTFRSDGKIVDGTGTVLT